MTLSEELITYCDLQLHLSNQKDEGKSDIAKRSVRMAADIQKMQLQHIEDNIHLIYGVDEHETMKK